MIGKRHILAIAISLGLASPVWAQSPLEDVEAAAELMARACIPDTLDFDQLFGNAIELVGASGLPVVSSEEKSSMFGNPGGAHLVVRRGIDFMHCSLNVPESVGTKDYFDKIQQSYEASVKGVYPKAMSIPSKSASPHEAKYEWLWRKKKDRHFAATLQWRADRGVSLDMGYSQKYD